MSQLNTHNVSNVDRNALLHGITGTGKDTASNAADIKAKNLQTMRLVTQRFRQMERRLAGDAVGSGA
jgi:hypothetical protein